ncbi:hypothetical protein SKAU_G00354850 [Synaphobranchus kaupii]|uniref:Ig-like domain-containing protein n=1 Tax=Synaphobranchus kaupii TaxID=118154 RepID=A0A9Q1IGI1_SYNKA|nr:hypothetical protein SKAU_G00354850 [Synaphobranchus kaupii]
MKSLLLLRTFWAICLFTILTAGEGQVTIVMAAPGSDITLSCFFPQRETNNPLHVRLIWLHRDTDLVHRYSVGRDQLQRQSPAYRGRTKLYPDQIAAGNASLRLTGVQESDHGKYTCVVDNEMGSFLVHVSVRVAAPYSEPQLSTQTTCNNITVTLTSSEGFPQPTLNWSWASGSEVTHLSLDSRGRYEVRSEMALQPNDALTVTVEVKLEVLNQSFSRTVTLHPLPECSVKRDTLWFLAPVVLLILVLALLLILLYIRRPHTGRSQSHTATPKTQSVVQSQRET